MEAQTYMARDPSGEGEPKVPKVQPPGSPNQLPSISPVASDHRFRFSNKKTSTGIEKLLVAISIFLVVIFFPFSLFLVFVSVRQFERAVILRNGKLHKNRALGPGLVLLLPCVDVIKYIDLRTMCYDVTLEDVLTKDELTVSVYAVVYQTVTDPVSAVMNVADYKKATRYLASTTLRNAVGTNKLSELLSNKAVFSNQVSTSMRHLTKVWGIGVKRVEIQELRLPLAMQKAMAAEAQTAQITRANISVAVKEIEANKCLSKATDILMESPLCMQLRYMQLLTMLKGHNSQAIIFPCSGEGMKKFFTQK